MAKLKHIMMLSCNKASEIIEKKLNFQLRITEKVQLFVHTKVCDACRNYEKQSTELDSLLDEHLNAESDDCKMPTEVKNKIIEEIEEFKK